MVDKAPLAYRWVILTIAWLTAFTCALTTFVYPPLLEEMIDALAMSLSQAGLLMSLTTLTTMSFTFVGGVLARAVRQAKDDRF